MSNKLLHTYESMYGVTLQPINKYIDEDNEYEYDMSRFNLVCSTNATSSLITALFKRIDELEEKVNRLNCLENPTSPEIRGD